jgi:tetratricopeptide (TPR) repeat protein
MQRYLSVVGSQPLSSTRWLTHHQMADGRWSGESVVEACRKDGTPKCEDKGRTGSELRATGLALVALLGAGYSHLSKENYDTKTLGETVQKAQQWMIAQQKVGGGFGDPASERFLEDHAIATLMMSEAYGMTASEPLKAPAQKAVDFLVASRTPGKGWALKAGKGAPDPVATGWALFALRSAKLSELKFPAEAMDQGLEWLIGAALQAPPARRDVGAAFAVAAATFLGKKLDADLLQAQLKVLPEAGERDALLTFLSAVSLRLADNGARWQSWRDQATSTLSQMARFDDEGNACPAGSWDPLGAADGPRGRVVTTALNLLTLEVCYGFKNVFCTPGIADPRALEIDPNSAAAHYDRGDAAREKGDLDGAIAEYTRALEVDPKYVPAYASRGAAKWAKGDLDGSIADSTRAIERDPKHAIAWYNRGGAKQAKEDFDGAIADYTRAVEIDPKYEAAYYNRGNAKLSKGDPDGAIADYTRAIEVNPKSSIAYYNRGNVKKRKGDLAAALADYTRSIEIDPTYAPAHFKRGTVKQGRGDLDGAVADYTRALELNPSYEDASYSRATAHYSRGAWKEALADYRKSFEFDYDYARVGVWLSRSWLNERDDATKELSRYLADRKTGKPDDWPSKVLRLLTGELREADFLKAAESTDAKTDREQKCEAYYYAGSRRLLEGDKSGARALFQKCLDTRVTEYNEYTSAAAELKRIDK